MYFKQLNFSVVPYIAMLELQHKIVQYKIYNPKCYDFLITLEHNPVYTTGRHADFRNLKISDEALKAKQIELINADRGGDITYHSPGQLTLYTIVNLKNIQKSLKNFVFFLEDVFIETLKIFHVESYKLAHLHGIFTDKGKIASIGLACKKSIVYHGVSLNVNNDLTPFSWINPCGLKDVHMTNIKSIIKKDINIGDVKNALLNVLKYKYKWEIEEFDYNNLETIINNDKTILA